MSDAIKLFGKRIAVPENQPPSDNVGERTDSVRVGEDLKSPCQEATPAETKDSASENPEEFDCNDITSSSNITASKELDGKAVLVDDKSIPDPDQEQAEQKASGQEKILKKPDKILPCPRCNSMDTKFCYYNNYNVNQPRHFCKNCQRYWTAGGTMRNVPVGAGRRKSKHSSSQYRQMMASNSEGMPSLRVDVPNPPHCVPARPFGVNGTVLKFGQEAQICDSMTNSLNLTEMNKKGEINPAAGSDLGNELPCSSLQAFAQFNEKPPGKVGELKQNANPNPCGGVIPLQSLPCYPGPPWAIHWSPGWNDHAATALASGTMVNGQESGVLNPMPWSLPPMMGAPAFVAPPIPIPFIPASFWGCMPSWSAGSWNIPLTGSRDRQSVSSCMVSSIDYSESAGASSPKLGKHSRDAVPQVEEKVEKSLWVPKTLRIDDPEEASKSSIWATLGIKQNLNEHFVKGGVFKSFQEKSIQADATPAMHANPAALSRSRTFQEST